MDRQSVESSNIKSIGYNLKHMMLEVEFHNGKIYQYHPLTEQAYHNLLEAESIGKFFFKNIKSNPGIKYIEVFDD